MSKSTLRVAESDAPAAMRERASERIGAVESKGSDGTFRIRVITEGEGTSGFYPRKLMEDTIAHSIIDGSVSFFDHPEYSFAPEDRSVTKIAARLVPGTTEFGVTDDGLGAIYANLKPREEYRDFITEFADVLGISIYMAASFTELPNGTRQVESLLPDPYNSVDIVVAAGRGGRFEAARESLRTIESSLGIHGGKKPSVEASAQEEEGNMVTKEEVAELLSPIVAAVAELKTAVTEKATAEATAEAVDAAVLEARAKAAAELEKIATEGDLLDSSRKALMESVAAGTFAEEDLVAAKAVAEEAKAKFATEDAGAGFVFEGKSTEDGAVEGAGSFRVGGWS